MAPPPLLLVMSPTISGLCIHVLFFNIIFLSTPYFVLSHVFLVPRARFYSHFFLHLIFLQINPSEC